MARNISSSMVYDATIGGVVVTTPYDARMVNEIKALPPAARRWDAAKKVWVIDPQHAKSIANAIYKIFGERVSAPIAPAARKETRILSLYYIGQAKDHGAAAPDAYAMDAAGAWSVSLPASVMREWFTGGADVAAAKAKAAAPGDEDFYALLGVKHTVDAADLKNAWRRMVMQWHPDRCREPNAQEVFMKIQHAYEVLGDPSRRVRYDVGLILQAQADKNKPVVSWAAKSGGADDGYRSPLRCGNLIAEGMVVAGRFVVEKILEWADIKDGYGRTLVSSWARGSDTPTYSWF